MGAEGFRRVCRWDFGELWGVVPYVLTWLPSEALQKVKLLAYLL